MKKVILTISAIALFCTSCIYQPTVQNPDSHHRTTEQLFADQSIDTKVKASYINNKIMGNNNLFITNIHVNTVDNVVYLSGTVDSEAQEIAAVQLAKEVKEVKGVKSDIKVGK